MDLSSSDESHQKVKWNFLGEANLCVAQSKFRRKTKGSNTRQVTENQLEVKQKWIQKWVEVRKTSHVEQKKKEPRIENLSAVVDLRKEIDVIWADKQKQRLQRSLLGVCMKSIKFGEVMDLLLEEWKGPVLGPSSSGDVSSCCSCPYPPGFRPCMDRVHVHREIARTQNTPQFMRNS
ncbi:hypothetical protein PIB30_056199 [Stylosanthes scabra]|uniref:Uncharacterized protein n=1 Tax=Stylosanthes scabra TaxID=79078 RepID=A0ABU6XH91_9FABA|nr:hypothetical protein [Stylosanthes scabra]